MLSYHNDPAVKAKYQQRFAAHRAADAVIQGTGYDYVYGRGCFVGCTLRNYDHALFPVELGWPEWLAHLADSIFEGLPEDEAPQFGTDLLEAVPVGVDLEPVKFRLAILRHERQLAALANNTQPYAEQCRAAIRGVIDYMKNALDGKPSASAWQDALDAAFDAARAANFAWVDAKSEAESDEAEAAAEFAESASRSIAEGTGSAARSASWSATYLDKAWQWERDTLLELVRATASTASANHDSHG